MAKRKGDIEEGEEGGAREMLKEHKARVRPTLRLLGIVFSNMILLYPLLILKECTQNYFVY